MASISQTITLYSGDVPNRNTMDMSAFDVAATTWADWQEDLPGQVNAWATQANALRTELSSWRTDVSGYVTAAQTAKSGAETAKGLSETARDVALVTANAEVYPSGTPYAIGACCIGSDGHTYRSLAANNSANPVGASTSLYLRLTVLGTDAPYEPLNANIAKINVANTWSGRQTFQDVVETIYTVTGTSPSIAPANGSIQTWNMTGNSSPTFSAVDGNGLLLMIDCNGYTINWASAVRWVGGVAPTLYMSGYTVVALWKLNSLIYGTICGDVQ